MLTQRRRQASLKYLKLVTISQPSFRDHIFDPRTVARILLFAVSDRHGDGETEIAVFKPNGL